MKTVTVLAAGSRGDVQPFLALAFGLAGRGHPVRLVSNAIYADLARSYGLEFRPLTWDPREAMRLQTRLGAERNPFVIVRKQLENTRRVYATVQAESWQACRDAQLLLFSVLSPWGYSISEKAGIPCVAGMLHPLEPTRAFPMQLIAPDLGGGLNRLSHLLAEQLFQAAAGGDINRFRRGLGLPALRFPDTLFGQLRKTGTPMLCNLSPAVLPRPVDWPERIHMDGYWFLPPPPAWRPQAELADFLAAGDAPVCIGFGSLVSGDLEGTRRLVDEALQGSGRRGILLTGWGGLAGAGSDPKRTLSAGDLPHAWLFERAAAAVHHGGAGTTSAALRAGIPQVIIAHMQDQLYWGRKMHRLGVSPAPLRRAGLSAGALAEAISTALQDGNIRSRAVEIGGRVRAEAGLEKTLAVIEAYFGL